MKCTCMPEMRKDITYTLRVVFSSTTSDIKFAMAMDLNVLANILHVSAILSRNFVVMGQLIVPDGIVMSSSEDTTGVIEIKCPYVCKI